jgi:hypothetical protein
MNAEALQALARIWRLPISSQCTKWRSFWEAVSFKKSSQEAPAVRRRLTGRHLMDCRNQ